MFKKCIFTLIVIIILLYLAVVTYIYHYDKHRSDIVSTEGLNEENARIQLIFNKHGCDYCHKAGTSMPFYASLPIIKQLIDKNVSQGQVFFLIANVEKALKDDNAVSQADLAKIEAVLLDGSMPPKLYKLLHWRGNISIFEREIVLNFIRNQRLKYYAAPNAAENMKTEPVQPLPPKLPYNVDKALLGEKLFNDVRISHDDTVSCSSCHNIYKGGADDNNKPTSLGIHHQVGPINAPTVFNAIFNHSEFWNGRAADLEDQAFEPPLNPVEGGSEGYNEIINKFKADPVFMEEFEKVYGYPFAQKGNAKNAMENIVNAIAEYEKTLITPSRFDLYLEGNPVGITPEQKRGYQLFKENRCVTCHVGVNFGGVSYEPLGLAKPYFINGRGPTEDNAKVTNADLGRYTVTHQERDKYRQKVPTLRNLSLTYPYFHRGNLGTIHEAVTQMLKYQVGWDLPNKDVNAIVAFIKSLDGIYTRKLPPPLPVWHPSVQPK